MVFYFVSSMSRFTLVVAVIWLAVMGTAAASPAYGTRMPAREEVFAGLQNYYMTDRQVGDNLGTVRSEQNYLTLSYGASDWLSLDLKASLYSSFRFNGDSGEIVKYANPVWGGGYGFRIKAYDSGPVQAVIGFQHFSIHPKTIKANGNKNAGILEDWQGSALVSYKLKKVMPYIGLSYTLLDYIRNLDNERKMFKSANDSRIGLVAGFDIPVNDRVWVNLESDWRESGAFTAGVLFRF